MARIILTFDVTAKAPPGMEGWVRKNKARFTREYGKKKGREILYKTAWKRHNASSVLASNHKRFEESLGFKGWDGFDDPPKGDLQRIHRQFADLLKKHGVNPTAIDPHVTDGKRAVRWDRIGFSGVDPRTGKPAEDGILDRDPLFNAMQYMGVRNISITE